MGRPSTGRVRMVVFLKPGPIDAERADGQTRGQVIHTLCVEALTARYAKRQSKQGKQAT